MKPAPRSGQIVPSTAHGLAGLPQLLALEKPLLALAALAATLAAALGLVPFFVVARMASAIYSTPARLDEVRSLAVVTIVALGVRYLLLAGANMLAHTAAFHVLHELRLRLARKLGAVPLSFFSHHSSGELRMS